MFIFKTKAQVAVLGSFLYVSGAWAQSAELSPTICRYTVDVLELKQGYVPSGWTFEDVPFVEQEELSMQRNVYTQTSGIDNQNRPYLETLFSEAYVAEDWIIPPHRLVVTPQESMGFGIDGSLEFNFPHSQQELDHIVSYQNMIEQVGYSPFISLFPMRHFPGNEELVIEGVLINDLSNGAYELDFGSGRKKTIFPDQLLIQDESVINEKRVRTMRYYKHFVPYGYVTDREYIFTTNAIADTSVMFLTRRYYSNYQVWDPGSVIQKTADVTKIEVFPVPLITDYKLRLMGVPDETISVINVYDYMGNLVAQHPGSQEKELHLNASSYPMGTLIISAVTDKAIYNTTVTKN